MDPSSFLITTGNPAAAPRRVKRTATVKTATTKKRLPAPERRKQLVEVAREVFLNVGRDGVSTHQIADAAGVNVSLLYQHFASSADLFDVAVLQPLEEILTERVQEGIDRLPPPGRADEATLVQLHEALLGLLVETAPVLPIALFGNQEAGREFYRDHIEPMLEKWIAAAYRNLKGRHRAADPVSVAKTIFGIHFTQAVYANLLGVELDVPEAARSISDFIYRGLIDAAK